MLFPSHFLFIIKVSRRTLALHRTALFPYSHTKKAFYSLFCLEKSLHFSFIKVRLPVPAESLLSDSDCGVMAAPQPAALNSPITASGRRDGRVTGLTGVSSPQGHNVKSPWTSSSIDRSPINKTNLRVFVKQIGVTRCSDQVQDWKMKVIRMFWSFVPTVALS